MSGDRGGLEVCGCKRNRGRVHRRANEKKNHEGEKGGELDKREVSAKNAGGIGGVFRGGLAAGSFGGNGKCVCNGKKETFALGKERDSRLKWHTEEES